MENRKFRVNGLDMPAQLCGDDAGIELSPKKDGQVFEGALVYAAVDLGSYRIRQRFRASIRNHADDRGPACFGSPIRTTVIRRPSRQAEPDAFAQRILVWPVGACRGLIDDRDLGRTLKILVAEKASAQQRHT